MQHYSWIKLNDAGKHQREAEIKMRLKQNTLMASNIWKQPSTRPMKFKYICTQSGLMQV